MFIRLLGSSPRGRKTFHCETKVLLFQKTGKFFPLFSYLYTRIKNREYEYYGKARIYYTRVGDKRLGKRYRAIGYAQRIGGYHPQGPINSGAQQRTLPRTWQGHKNQPLHQRPRCEYQGASVPLGEGRHRQAGRSPH